MTEAPACAGEDVYIVGGANSAGQAAVFLRPHARRVTLLVRGDRLERSMSYYLVRQIDELPNIEVRLSHRGDRGGAARIISSSDLVQRGPGSRRRSRPATSSCSSAPNLGRSGSKGVLGRDARFRAHGPGPGLDGQRPRGWDLDRDPYHSWRPACPACSPPATSGPTRSSGSLRRSGEGAWRSSSCIRIWSTDDRNPSG